MEKPIRRIAFYFPKYAGGGAEHVSMTLARLLVPYGYEFEFWATRFDKRRRAELEREGVLTASPRDGGKHRRQRSRKTMEFIAQTVLERNIDILVLAVSPLEYMAELRATIGHRCKIVFHLHGQPYWEMIPYSQPKPSLHGLRQRGIRCFNFLRKDIKQKLFRTYTRRIDRLYRETYDNCDAYLVLCQRYKTDLEQKLGLSSGDSRIKAFYNPVSGMEKLSQNFGKPKKREVLYVGRLEYSDKRVDRLIRIWAAAQRPGWILRIVGDGPERMNLENQCAALGLDNVRFEGYAVPFGYYADAAIVALTSTFEGWPGILLEALAAGCSPIAFACSEGVEEILDEGRGVTVAPFDEDEYALRLSAMMDAYPCPVYDDTARWLLRFSDKEITSSWCSLLRSLETSEPK